MKKNNIIFIFILLIGLATRLYGNNWDQGWHLHPDERFLTMVGIDMKLPNTVSDYLNAKISSFNPANSNHSFFVYGTLPLLINKAISIQIYTDTYDLFNLTGRVLSALADFFVILVIFKLVKLIEKKVSLPVSIKYLSAFLYAISVHPIQLSHFFAVDTFLNLFVWMSLYFAVKSLVQEKKSAFINILFSGSFFGFALACKVSALYVLPLIGLVVVSGIIKTSHIPRKHPGTLRFLLPLLPRLTSFAICAYIALRLGSPHYFETGSIFNPQLSSAFIDNIKTLKSYDDPQTYFPPAIQWLSKSYGFPIRNIIFYGVGPVYFLFAVVGAIVLLAKKNTLVLVSIAWTVLFILYQSFQFAKTMRYLIFIYPFLAIMAGVGLWAILHKVKYHTSRLVYLSISSFIFMAIIVWPLAFMSIYGVDHSRVVASKWIYKNVLPGSTLLTEYWDDPLPLMVQDPTTRNYVGKEVHIFDPDSGEKWNAIKTQIADAEYYIMSSNRGWGSIMEVPDRYPIAAEFYKKMLSGRGEFKLVRRFASYPSLRYLGIPVDFPDQWAEEAFTVYDHPEVQIFKKN